MLHDARRLSILRRCLLWSHLPGHDHHCGALRHPCIFLQYLGHDIETEKISFLRKIFDVISLYGLLSGILIASHVWPLNVDSPMSAFFSCIRHSLVSVAVGKRIRNLAHRRMNFRPCMWWCRSSPWCVPAWECHQYTSLRGGDLLG